MVGSYLSFICVLQEMSAGSSCFRWLPLFCYAFYLYVQSINPSNNYSFKVKALKIYAFCDLCPDSKVQYTVEPVTSTGLFPILGILKLSVTLWSKIFCPTV